MPSVRGLFCNSLRRGRLWVKPGTPLRPKVLTRLGWGLPCAGPALTTARTESSLPPSPGWDLGGGPRYGAFLSESPFVTPVPPLHPTLLHPPSKGCTELEGQSCSAEPWHCRLCSSLLCHSEALSWVAQVRPVGPDGAAHPQHYGSRCGCW